MTELNCLALYGSFTKKSLIAYIKNNCIEEELEELTTTYRLWLDASNKFLALQESEKNIADNCEISEVESPIVTAMQNHPMIKYSFSNEEIEFKMVDIDNAIVTQNDLILDYVDKLEAEVPNPPSEEALLKFCLTPEKKVHRPKARRKDTNSYLFSSPSREFRFLGGFLKKEITKDDLDAIKVGGFPTHAIMLVVGYGVFSMSAYQVDGRIILNNGFHRAYALRRKGIKKIPMILIKRSRSDFPEQLRQYKKDYLLNEPRPVLMKDFFNHDLVREFKHKPTTTILNLKWETDRVVMDL